MPRPICGSEKYKLAGSKEDVIILPVSLDNLPPKIEAEGYNLSSKKEFHCSLVCIGKIIEKHKVSIPNFTEKVIADFCEFIKDNEVNLLRYRDEFRFVTKEDEGFAVILMCDIANLDKFFELINKKYGLQVEYPPTHITLYTFQGVGVFLTDSQDIQKFTKAIANPTGIQTPIEVKLR